MKRTFLYLLVLSVGLGFWGMGCVGPQVRSGYDLGSYKLSVYWLAHEHRFRGKRRVPLFFGKLKMTRVSKRFARAIRMQGTGRLRDGTLVQYVRTCRYRGRFCLKVRVVNKQVFPMGVGAAGIALQPLRSVAADGRFRFGTSLYIPRLGKLIRRRGQRHDGCFVVHDRGGRIRGNRLDLFTGSHQIFRRYLRRRFPRYVRVYANHRHCTSHLAQIFKRMYAP